MNILTSLIDSKIEAGQGTRTALRFKHKEDNCWRDTSWSHLAEMRDSLAAGLISFGVGVQDKIAIFSANRPGILVADFAAYALRAIPVSIYSTSSEDQVDYIVHDAGCRIIFVGDREQYIIARKVQKKGGCIERIVTFDSGFPFDSDDTTTITFGNLLDEGEKLYPGMKDEISARTVSATPDDIITLIYTSGTTGEPKGAVLTHSNMDAAMRIHDIRLTMLSSDDTSICFLPLCHIFEKAWTYYCLHRSMIVNINHDPKDITTSLREVRPTCMCSVPRFWEKAYNLIQDKMSKQKGFKKLLVRLALSVGRKRNMNYHRKGLKAPWFLELQYRFFDKRIFSGVRRVMGIEKGNIFPTAGAPLSDTINEFFHSIGVNLVIGYGLSETTATVSCYPETRWKLNSVGTALPEINVRVAEDGEIQVKAPTVMRGYYNKPELTGQVFTDDGWFRTGDAGVIDKYGNITITDRLKDLFKTSNGKYIAPQVLETRLVQDPFIEQVAVIGDRRKYVTALISPALDAIKEYASENGINFTGIRDLLTDSRIVNMISSRIDALQAGLASYEKIKKFTLLPREFSMERGELTNTLKIRRKIINSHFAKEIDAMYA